MSDTLYERLGGEESIGAVVDEFYDRIVSDERVNHFFEDVDMEAQRAHQTQFLSSVAGGPVEYSGAEMEAAHDHLDVSEPDFEIIAVHLDESLAAFDVPETEREEVLSAVGELQPAIVSE